MNYPNVIIQKPIEPAQTAWVASVVSAPKKNKILRFGIDCRRLKDFKNEIRTSYCIWAIESTIQAKSQYISR